MNPAANAPRSIGLLRSSSATRALVVPRVITTVPEVKACFTTGSAATPLAINRFEAFGFKTTQAFIVLPFAKRLTDML